MKLGMFMMPVNDHRRDTHVVLKEDVEIAAASLTKWGNAFNADADTPTDDTNTLVKQL